MTERTVKYIVILKEDMPLVGRVHKKFATLNGYIANMTVEQKKELAKDKRVKSIERDRKVSLAQSPVPSWGIDRIDQRSLPLDNTYSYTTTGIGVKVYIVDSGIRFTHSEFGGRAVPGFDAVNDGQNGNDCYGHGTHISATVGGATAGVAKSVQLVSVRVFDCVGSGQISSILAGVDWITSQIPKAKSRRFPMVVNISLVFAGTSPALAAAIESSISKGIVYVVAAGNSNMNACNYSPAQISNVITVGATFQTDERAPFSNYGSCVDIYAPGYQIVSASNVDDQSFTEKSGTSMSAPHVAGVAALYLENYPKATPAQVTTAILNNSTAINDGKLLFSLF